jgi:ABC-type bacteriocin/lantibiotic exporter with double-glycine peptidase domain
MLRVPRLKQPDSTSCLPTCVEAVLRYHGYAANAARIREWCYTTSRGSDADLAVQGLNEAGIDAELLQCGSLAEIRELLDQGRPPIVLLFEVGDYYHTVVVCDLDGDVFTFMDPRTGEYVQASAQELSLDWAPPSGEVLLIGGSPEGQG